MDFDEMLKGVVGDADKKLNYEEFAKALMSFKPKG